jgi:uncharacterized glyoxalase superfamily protein PhnB
VTAVHRAVRLLPRAWLQSQGEEPGLDTRPDRRASAYLFVEDADALARTWAGAGGDVRLPEDTEWGQHEGVLIDPDGNVIRFGSPMDR